MEEFSFKDLLSQAESAGFSALPANDYDVIVASSEVRQTGTGKQKISVKFQVTSGPHSGRNIFDDIVLSPGNPNAMVMFFRRMNSMGHDSGYFSQDPPLGKVAADLVGRVYRVKVGTRVFNDQERNEIKAIVKSSSNGHGPVPGGMVPAAAPAPAMSMPSPAPVPVPSPTPPAPVVPVPTPAPPTVPPVTESAAPAAEKSAAAPPSLPF